MDAGKLDRRVRLEQYTTTQAPNGEPTKAWTTLATVWAEKIEANGQERFSSQQFIGKVARSFRFRWSNATSQVTVKSRLVFDGVTHEIIAMREIGFRDGIEVDCVARSEDPLSNG